MKYITFNGELLKFGNLISEWIYVHFAENWPIRWTKNASL